MNSREHKGKVLDTIDGSEIIQCRACGYIHKHPLPDKEEWQMFYEKEFYYIDDKRDSYLSDTEKDTDYRELLHEDKYSNLIRLGINPTGASLLDIGSGGGLLLEYFSLKGWDVLGVEPSIRAYQFATKRNRNTVNQIVEQFLATSMRKFDVIHLRGVLDNILNPIEILRELKVKALKETGILVVDTSNDYNDFQKCICDGLGERPWWIEGDTLNFFTVKSLRRLFRTAGLRILHQEATFPLELFALVGENYIRHPELGKIIHKKRVHFEKVLVKAGRGDVKRRFYKALASAGLGRSIIMYGTAK